METLSNPAAGHLEDRASQLRWNRRTPLIADCAKPLSGYRPVPLLSKRSDVDLLPVDWHHVRELFFAQDEEILHHRIICEPLSRGRIGGDDAAAFGEDVLVLIR